MAQEALARSPFVLETASREVIDTAIRDVCVHRGWTLHALNVRTNHVHLVVSTGSTPEQMMTSLKAWCTRRLRQAGLIPEGIKPWSRHGSTRYLWQIHEIEAACQPLAIWRPGQVGEGGQDGLELFRTYRAR